MAGYADPDIKQTSKFLKIDSGQPHDIRLLDADPFVTFEHFSPAGSIECKGQDVCGACADGDEAQQKFSTNVYDHTEKKVKIWKYGTGVAKQLQAIAITLQEEERSIMEVDVKVDATGSNKQKKYTVTPRMSAKAVPSGLTLFKLDIPF